MNESRPMPEDRDRFRNAAMAERPPFSPQIHGRVMSAIHRSAPRRSLPATRVGRWLGGVAAAALLVLAGGMLTHRFDRQGRYAPPQPPTVIATNPPPAAQTPASSADLLAPPLHLTITLRGTLSATASPLRIAIGLPALRADASPPNEAAASPAAAPLGSPEWLLARLQQPARQAQAELAGVLPVHSAELQENQSTTHRSEE